MHSCTKITRGLKGFDRSIKCFKCRTMTTITDELKKFEDLIR